MASKLTWQQVSAPDFSSSANLLKTASDQFGRAGQSLENILGTLDQQARNQAGVEFLRDQQQYQDPASLRQALMSGSLGQNIDPRRLTPEMLAGAQSQVENLLNQSRTQQQIKAGDLALQRGTREENAAQETDQYFRNNPDVLLRIAQAQSTGQMGDVASILSDAPASVQQQALGSYDPQTRLKIQEANSVLGQKAEGVRIQSKLNELVSAQLSPSELITRGREFENSITDPGLRKQFRDGMAQLSGRPMYERDIDLSPNELTSSNQDIPSYIDPQSTQRGYNNRGNLTEVISLRDTITHMRDNVRTPIAGGKTTSSYGLYQFQPGTVEEIAPKVLGSGWESQPFNYENQSKLARYYFDQHKSGDLTKKWAGVEHIQGSKEKGAWQDIDPDTALLVIAANEGGGVTHPVTGEDLSKRFGKGSKVTMDDVRTLSAEIKSTPAQQLAVAAQDAAQAVPEALQQAQTPQVMSEAAEALLGRYRSQIQQFQRWRTEAAQQAGTAPTPRERDYWRGQVAEQDRRIQKNQRISGDVELLEQMSNAQLQKEALEQAVKADSFSTREEKQTTKDNLAAVNRFLKDATKPKPQQAPQQPTQQIEPQQPRQASQGEELIRLSQMKVETQRNAAQQDMGNLNYSLVQYENTGVGEKGARSTTVGQGLETLTGGKLSPEATSQVNSIVKSIPELQGLNNDQIAAIIADSLEDNDLPTWLRDTYSGKLPGSRAIAEKARAYKQNREGYMVRVFSNNSQIQETQQLVQEYQQLSNLNRARLPNEERRFNMITQALQNKLGQ